MNFLETVGLIACVGIFIVWYQSEENRKTEVRRIQIDHDLSKAWKAKKKMLAYLCIENINRYLWETAVIDYVKTCPDYYISISESYLYRKMLPNLNENDYLKREVESIIQEAEKVSAWKVSSSKNGEEFNTFNFISFNHDCNIEDIDLIWENNKISLKK